MNNDLKKALMLILEEKYDKKNPRKAFQNLDVDSYLLTIPTGTTIIWQNDSVDYIYFLLSGQTLIMNSIDFTTNHILDYVEPPHILGLIETITNTPSYTAYVVTNQPCVFFRLSASDFLNILHTDIQICFRTLQVVTKVACSNMDLAETHRTFQPKDILGRYLYLQAAEGLPYVCPLTRRELSEKLNINLRSLYRYLSSLNESDFIQLRNGRIVIEDVQFHHLTSRYGKIIM